MREETLENECDVQCYEMGVIDQDFGEEIVEALIWLGI